MVSSKTSAKAIFCRAQGKLYIPVIKHQRDNFNNFLERLGSAFHDISERSLPWSLCPDFDSLFLRHLGTDIVSTLSLKQLFYCKRMVKFNAKEGQPVSTHRENFSQEAFINYYHGCCEADLSFSLLCSEGFKKTFLKIIDDLSFRLRAVFHFAFEFGLLMLMHWIPFLLCDSIFFTCPLFRLVRKCPVSCTGGKYISQSVNFT